MPPQMYVQEGLTDSGKAPLQGGDALLGGRQQVGDSAKLRLHSSRDDLREPGPGRDRGAHEDEVMTLGERRIGSRRHGCLLDRCAFPRQWRFIGRQRVGRVQARVRCSHVTRLENEEIPWHDLVGGNHDAVAVPPDSRPGRRHRAQRHHGAFRTVLLQEADLRIHDHNRADGDRIQPFAEGRGQDARAEQEPDHRAGKLVGDQHEGTRHLFATNLVRTEVAQPAQCLGRGQAFGRRQ
jgi:hypothetical protein